MVSDNIESIIEDFPEPVLPRKTTVNFQVFILFSMSSKYLQIITFNSK